MKKLFIPVAAFAITATSVSAYSSDIFEKINIDLSSDEIAALETAHELRKEGDRDGAIEVLEDAGLGREDLQEIRQAVREYRQEVRAEVREAVENEDYDDFIDAAAGTKLGEAIESESDFELLLEAKELRDAGDKEGAKAIMEELGIERPGKHKHGWRGGSERGERFQQ